MTAAKDAGIGFIAYTSAPAADSSDLVLAPEHKATEALIRASGIPFAILRNGWYTENYAQVLEQARHTGLIIASLGDGRVASASRRDYAEAAAVVLTGDGHAGKVYELSGDTSWDYVELASTIADLIGREVTYHRVTPRGAPHDSHRCRCSAAPGRIRGRPRRQHPRRPAGGNQR